MSSKVISINKVRKKRDRAEAKAEADANAAKHGRTKAQRLLEAAREEQARKRLDQSKFDE